MCLFLTIISIVLFVVNVSYGGDVSVIALKNPTMFELKMKFKLSCNVTSDSKDVEVTWEKDGQSIFEVPDLKDRVKQLKDKTVHSILVTRSSEHDSGSYTCKARIGDETLTVEMKAYNKIRLWTPSNVNVVEGEKLKIVCSVYGIPPPYIYWIAINETYTESRGRFELLTDEETKIPNTILTMENIQMSDRGIYICVANATLTHQHVKHETMVRIKDKYAALWPFIGICIEVFVLCAIILIYEKKRNKTELEESDTDQSPDQKNTPNHGKDSNLRHRQ